jgi:hypothetical protein
VATCPLERRHDPPLTLLLCLALPGTVLAQSAAGATAPQAAGLDLTLPQAPMRYLNDPALQQDPPAPITVTRAARACTTTRRSPT